MRKKEGTIQYGCRRGTHARVFFQTLVNGNSKNKIKKQTKKVKREARVWKEVQRARKKSPVSITTSSKYNNNKQHCSIL